ncbi:MAG: hypothetical protein J5590_09825 [Clostridia bacterium]|nr:hypothetical protein [Clostridia bacterium]
MKKTTLILCLIAALLCFASCKKAENTQNPGTSTQTAETPDASAEPQAENGDEDTAAPEGENEPAVSNNKLEPATYYGGPVKSIEEDKIVIVSDITDEEIEFALSEKAKSDIAHFSVTEGTIVVVDYELSEDGNTKTATDVSLVRNNLPNN